jgi:hypothetical protein
MSESGIQPGTENQVDGGSTRIIYMGDVRRRRGKQRQAPDRQYLGAIALVALSAWSIWITVLFSLEPARFLTYVAFFLPLAVALAASGTLIAYAVDWRSGNRPSLGAAARRGLLFASLAVANLSFQAAHRWSPLIGVITILLVLGLEASALRRQA